MAASLGIQRRKQLMLIRQDALVIPKYLAPKKTVSTTTLMTMRLKLGYPFLREGIHGNQFLPRATMMQRYHFLDSNVLLTHQLEAVPSGIIPPSPVFRTHYPEIL